VKGKRVKVKGTGKYGHGEGNWLALTNIIGKESLEQGNTRDNTVVFDL
jgi:hypothetical protein